MIHIVSGFPRSGTSAMMLALVAGGMTAAYSEHRDKLAEAHADEHYHPNKAGLYEVPLKEYGNIDFPLAYQGKLIKVLLWGLDSLAVNPEGYRVVIMRRDPEEIRQSYEAFFGQKLKHPWMAEYEERIKHANKILGNRRDVCSLKVLHYLDVIDNPLDSMWEMCRCGWQINPNAAASTIDPTLYRFRKELLTAGI